MLMWDEFRNGIAFFVAAFPKLEPSEETIKAWYVLLQDIPATPFHRAVIGVCKSLREVYPGTNVVEAIREAALPSWTSTVTPLEAWGKVMREVHRMGEHGKPAIEDALAEEVAYDIGWVTLCLSENIAVERAHFLADYDRRAKQRPREALTRTLTEADYTPQELGSALPSLLSGAPHNRQEVR